MHEELAQELEAQYELNRSMYEQIETWNELFLEFQEFEVNLLFALCFFKHSSSFREAPVILNDSIVVVTVRWLKREHGRNSKPRFGTVNDVFSPMPKTFRSRTTDNHS